MKRIVSITLAAAAILPLSIASCSSGGGTNGSSCASVACATPTCPEGFAPKAFPGNCCESCVADEAADAGHSSTGGSGSGCEAVRCAEPMCPDGFAAETLPGSCCQSCVSDDRAGAGGGGTGGAGTGGAPNTGTMCGTSQACGDTCYIDPCPGLPCGAAGVPGACDSAGQCVLPAEVDCSMAVDCPQSPPASGDPCATTGDGLRDEIHCVWGDHPQATCRDRGTCVGGAWMIQPAPASCSGPPLPPGCPETAPSTGDQCSDTSLGCSYPDGTACGCSNCRGGSSNPVCEVVDIPEWGCARPGPGCPTSAPDPGDPCTVEQVDCAPGCDLAIVCLGGQWRWRNTECPICAAPDTPVATPSGERAISDLRVGDLVYSVDGDAIVAVPIVRADSTPVHDHRVVRIALDGGRTIEMSPGHPTADGRPLGSLSAGDGFDAQHRVASVELVAYAHDRTYDILPASETGAYFAAGALVGSTLKEPSRGPSSSKFPSCASRKSAARLDSWPPKQPHPESALRSPRRSTGTPPEAQPAVQFFGSSHLVEGSVRKSFTGGPSATAVCHF